MFIAIAVLLLLLFILSFWIVKESNIPNYLKVVSISLFFSFCVIMAVSLESSMGWAAPGEKLEGKVVTIRYVFIKEPDTSSSSKGNIFIIMDVPSQKTDNFLLNLFGHKIEGNEPRWFKVPYSRFLHEQLQNKVIPKLMKGQTVRGKFGKGKGKGNGNGGEGGNGAGDDEDEDGEGNGRGGQGGRGGRGGSESIEQNDMMFYELPPVIFNKNTNK